MTTASSHVEQWTLGAAWVTVVVALVSAIFGVLAWKAANEAVEPLKDTATELKTVAKLQERNVALAIQLQHQQTLTRRLQSAHEAFQALLSMSLIGPNAVNQASDEASLVLIQDSMFMSDRARLLAALVGLPGEALPQTRAVSTLFQLAGSTPKVAGAQVEMQALISQMEQDLMASESDAEAKASENAPTDSSLG